MNNCDLETLSVSPGVIAPSFHPSICEYKATVQSDVSEVKVKAVASDSGASFRICGKDGSKSVTLKDGSNIINIEVTAEDGTTKMYSIEVTKLSAKNAVLDGLNLAGDFQLIPLFESNIHEYSCIVPCFINTLTVQPSAPDKNMKVYVNDSVSSASVALTVGDTVIEIKVYSPDETNSQTYDIVVTRMEFPLVVNFFNAKEQSLYECPISLKAFYRPVSIKGSDPKHTFSTPCIDMLTRRSKIDPLNEMPLEIHWKNPEFELERQMSAASVFCSYSYRGCNSIVKFSELGQHILECPCKPPGQLDVKEVTENEWYRTQNLNLQFQIKHTLQIQNWEKRLQQMLGEHNVDKLCSYAEEYIKIYKQQLPKPGELINYEEGCHPLDALQHVTIAYASAIKLRPRDPKLHLQLGLALEEYYYAISIYGLQKKREDESLELNSAKASSRDEEILAICTLHGLHGKPTIENQLKALDAEFRHLKDLGQSARSDYVQMLFNWKSKMAAKDGIPTVSDEESPLHQALIKYLDALFLDSNNWKYNFHVGRLSFLQGKCKEAVQYLQKSVYLNPASPSARLYTGLSLLSSEEETAQQAQEAIKYIQQGLDHLLNKLFTEACGRQKR
ncbi:uncharacterized protein LOC127525920 [Erpetoichthys calabaricus]|uniref:uncharacterized protein LOC127525920 n=1 Tax=Erpetoichthys calabaricus TaxID=27687 RepID=UPI0022346E55|nr:uncharacterized protein LOC127525920 [Erpetoichthys calabaricus]